MLVRIASQGDQVLIALPLVYCSGPPLGMKPEFIGSVGAVGGECFRALRPVIRDVPNPMISKIGSTFIGA